MFELKQFSLQRSFQQKLYFAIWSLVSALFFSSSFPFPSSFKVGLLKLFGATVGSGVIIRSNIFIKFPKNLRISDFVWIGYGVQFHNDELITIDTNVCISQNCCFYSGSHDVKSSDFRYMGDPISIEKNVWIASNSIILPGVRVCEGTFVRAGSLLKK